MKKYLFFYLIIICCLTSCTIKEKMVINDDGSGSFFYGFDMAGLYKMGMKKTDSTAHKKVVDTVFNFKDIFNKAKDSIAKLPLADREMLKVLESFKINLKINEEKKQFEYNMAFDFPTLDSIQNMAPPSKAMEVLALTDKKQLGALSALPKKETEKTSFVYDGNVFIKTTDLPKNDKNRSPKSKKKGKDKDEPDPFFGKMTEMLKECKYSMEYHFPKKIKTVSLKNAIIAPDRKSFVYDIPLEDLEEADMDLGFKVTFEN
ncbi:hypothetical protein ACFFLS_14945 [Flavobacterium procerum]|uniref:Lipoprotein n=1 Tax=Flavobacterium procerum TaxID=1455569 RepID=A0ABV6BWD0_9FLAO